MAGFAWRFSTGSGSPLLASTQYGVAVDVKQSVWGFPFGGLVGERRVRLLADVHDEARVARYTQP